MPQNVQKYFILSKQKIQLKPVLSRETRVTPTQNKFQYKKQGPSPISLVRATKIFSKTKTLKKKLIFKDNPIYPFRDAHGQAG